MLQTITKVYKQTNKTQRLAFYLHYLKRNMFICSEFKKIKVNDKFSFTTLNTDLMLPSSTSGQFTNKAVGDNKQLFDNLSVTCEIIKVGR